MKEGKLVGALRAFMEKTVSPSLGEDHPSLNEWKFLNGILSAQPIDPSQLDFYLLMTNKADPPRNNKPTRQPSNLDRSQTNPPERTQTQSDLNSRPKPAENRTRKTLLSNMQAFQALMVRNQERLEGIGKKDASFSYTQSSMAGSKKFIT